MGSFPSDVTFKVNIDPASAIANFKKIEEAFKKGSQGIAGEYEKGAKMAMNMAKQMIDVSNRAGRQLESQLRSIEKQTQSLGKSATEMNEIQRKWMLERARGLKNQEEQEKRINAIYDQRKKFFEEEERRAKTGPNTGNLLFRGARDIFEGRMSYGVMDIGRAVLGTTGGGGAGAAAGGAGLGGGAALLGIAAGFGAIAVGAYKAAESIGEFGQKIHEVQIVTGMSAKEVQQFDVAAKMTGHDVTEINRMMRGLTQAVTDTSAAGEKGRAGLRALGVDVVGLQLGTVNATEAFLHMGEALKKQPDVFERNSEMMAIFKRAGIEATGTIVELADAIKRTSGTPFLTEEQIQQAKDMHDQIVQMNAQWEYFWNQVKLHAGSTFFSGLQGLKFALPGAAQTATGSLLPTLPEPTSPAAGTGMAAISDMLQGQYQAAVTRESGRGLEGAEKTLERLKKAYDDALASQTLFFRDAEKGTHAWQDAVDKSRVAMEKQDAVVKAMHRAESDRLAIEEAIRRAGLLAEQRAESPFLLPAQAQLNRDLRLHGLNLQGPEAATLRRLYGPQITFEEAQQAAKFQTQMLEVQQTVTREMDRARAGGVLPVNIRQLGVGGVTRADVVSDLNAQEQQRRDLAMETFEKEYKLIKDRKIDAADRVALAKQQDDIVAATGKLAVAQIEAEMAKKREMYALDQHERDLERQHRETMSRIQLADQEESIKHDADLERKRAQLRFKGDNPAAGIAEEYRIAITESQQLYDLEMQRIALHETGFKAEEDAAIALHKLHRDDEQAREDAQFKLAQMQQQQLDNLKNKIEPLYHTLFTNPRQFGSQLRQSVQEAALHPIVSGLSEMTATALHPLIYGAGGTGGLAGGFRNMFGGGRLNDVQLINGAVPVHIVGSGGGGGMMPAGTSIYSMGGFSGGGGTGGFSAASGGFSPAPWFIGPGGTAGFAPGPIGLPGGGGGGGGFGGFGGGTATGGGGFNLGGIAGLARNLGTNWRQMLGLSRPSVFGETPGGESMARAAGTGFLGNLKNIAASPLARAGLMSGGMMSAQAGLLGQRRGTALGVLEGTLGGAAIGAGLAPPGFQPLGAAIGAGVGLGIGVGEMIAGVESPREEAKRLVRQVYHIGINNSTADQIVSIANQSYSGHVSLAVHSPEVRHMLGLYAAGTGQGSIFAQSANEAHGASLVESGGVLSQQATYQYGQAFSQSSNLPIYGNTPTQVLGAPGGGMQLSLNIGGQDAARFMTGQVVTPDVVQTQYAAAMNNSSGRVPQALMMSEPGSIAS